MRMKSVWRYYYDNVWSTYNGFPCFTSSEATRTSGTVILAAFKAAAAYLCVADVQIAQEGFGRWREGKI